MNQQYHYYMVEHEQQIKDIEAQVNLFPHQGWIAARAAYLPTKEHTVNMMFSAHG